jgi:hypothetical protein
MAQIKPMSDQEVAMSEQITAHGICKKCGATAVHLAMGGVFEIHGDRDDDLGEISTYADEILEVEISIGTHVCFACGEIEDAWVEDPRQDDEQAAELAALRDALLAIIATDNYEMAERIARLATTVKQ